MDPLEALVLNALEIKTFWAACASIFALCGFFPYLYSVFKRKTQPHEFTWLLFLLTQGTATAILWLNGGGRGAMALTIGTVFITVVFFLSLIDGQRDITKSDIACLVLALAAFPLWLVLKQPLAATILLTSIDMLAYVPTFRKAYKHPYSETVLTWSLFFFSDLFSIFALETYTALTLTYLGAITTANVVLVTFLLTRRAALKKAS